MVLLMTKKKHQCRLFLPHISAHAFWIQAVTHCIPAPQLCPQLSTGRRWYSCMLHPFLARLSTCTSKKCENNKYRILCIFGMLMMNTTGFQNQEGKKPQICTWVQIVISTVTSLRRRKYLILFFFPFKHLPLQLTFMGVLNRITRIGTSLRRAEVFSEIALYSQISVCLRWPLGWPTHRQPFHHLTSNISSDSDAVLQVQNHS